MQGQPGEMCAQQVCWVPVDRITPRASRPFARDDSASLNDLAESIRRDGLIQPITVRPLAGGRFEIVSGNRRYLACRMIGMTHVDAIILASDPREASAQVLLDRLLAGGLHYLEQAETLRELHAGCGMSRELLAQQLGMTPAAVWQRMRLADLDEQSRALLMESQLPERCAAALLHLPDTELRAHVLRQAVNEHLSPRDAELLITSAQSRLPVPPPPGRTVTLMHDSRLYINAVRAIAAQMKEAGIPAEFTETTGLTSTTITMTVPTRRRRTERRRQSQSSQACQCVSYRSHSPMT